MRMTVPQESLARIVTPRPGGAEKAQPALAGAGARAKSAGAGVDIRMQARATISPEIHLRGMRADEALTRLEGYVEEACLAGLSPFRIVHGKGTGALKKVVWEHLKTHPNIARFSHPSEEEGGNGVTIAELRE
jgi:DNA mismatch repair protein MutS2